MKKTLSMALIASQVLFAQAGYCAQTSIAASSTTAGEVTGTTQSTATLTPEAQLVQRVIAIGGLGLPQQQWQLATHNAVAEYVTQTPGKTETDRETDLQQAFVTLKIYNQDQSTDLMTQARKAATHLTTTTQTTTTSATATATSTELGAMLHNMPQGAQFSSRCENDVNILSKTGIGLFVMGVFAIIAQGNNVPLDNWAAVMTESGFGLALLGIALSYSCG